MKYMPWLIVFWIFYNTAFDFLLFSRMDSKFIKNSAPEDVIGFGLFYPWVCFVFVFVFVFVGDRLVDLACGCLLFHFFFVLD